VWYERLYCCVVSRPYDQAAKGAYWPLAGKAVVVFGLTAPLLPNVQLRD
jgi:hypothetical protein